MAWSNHKHVPANVRKRIIERDQETCQHCGAQGVSLEVDHISNTRNALYDSDANLQALCRSCHHRKTTTETQKGRNKRKSLGLHPGDKHPAYW